MTPDLTGSLGQGNARALLDACIDAAQSDANRHTFLSTSFDTARQAADAADAAQRSGAAQPALAH